MSNAIKNEEIEEIEVTEIVERIDKLEKENFSEKIKKLETRVTDLEETLDALADKLAKGRE